MNLPLHLYMPCISLYSTYLFTKVTQKSSATEGTCVLTMVLRSVIEGTQMVIQLPLTNVTIYLVDRI